MIENEKEEDVLPEKESLSVCPLRQVLFLFLLLEFFSSGTIMITTFLDFLTFFSFFARSRENNERKVIGL